MTVGARVTAAPLSIDPEHPWLGLSSYTEETRAYFHGRDEEAAELARRVQRKNLTVLFGQSGLGKTLGKFDHACILWFNNDYATYKNIYGALYNWYAVTTGKIAPSGWHIPSDEEWTILTTFLGGEDVAGGKMKETGVEHWTSPNTGATNSSGFTGFPAGDRGSWGIFYPHTYNASYWSSTKIDLDESWIRLLNFAGVHVVRPSMVNYEGMPVCIMD